MPDRHPTFLGVAVPPSRTVKNAAVRGLRRICYAGLDSVELRREVRRRLEVLIPSEAFTFATTDPDTGLLTHAVSEGVPRSVYRSWIDHLYPYRVAAEVLDMVRVGPTVTAECSEMVRDVLAPGGLRYDLRGVLCEQDGPVGFVCLLRETGSGEFHREEVRLLEEILPHLTRGLVSATLLDQATTLAPQPTANGRTPQNGTSPVPTGDAPSGPGVILLDDAGVVQTRNAAARRFLADLSDSGDGPDGVPSCVASVVGRLLHLHRNGGSDPDLPLEAHLRARGHSGRWYSIRASLTEPDPAGRSSTIVLISRATSREIAPILARLYGLTPREREILVLAARGWSTKRMSQQLEISSYTVQEHVGNACAKVGVRTRRELLARIFFDGYAGNFGA